MSGETSIGRGGGGISRRGLVAAGIGVAAGALAGPALGAARRLAPSDRVNLAVIGAGGKGADDMSRLTDQNIVATADVDYDHVWRGMLDRHYQMLPTRQAVKAAYDKARRYTDYRRMFDQQKDIDAVLIATPDHHHAVAARMAMERGLHVYVQKPLTYTVEEGRKLLALARADPGLVTQMGCQGHSGDDGRRVVELIRGKAIGRIKEVHVWTNRPVWPQGIARPPPQPTPPDLDWPTWLGPANVDWGYNPDYAAFNWRGWVPFGCGALGDMGAHLIDFPFWALEPGLPTKIETRHSRWPGNPDLWSTRRPAVLEGFPLAEITHYEFAHAPRKLVAGGTLHMTWYDGGILPPTPLGFPADLHMNPEGGVLFVGTEGMLMHETYGERPVLIGEGLTEKAARIPHSLPRIAGGMWAHEQNWIRAIRGEEKVSCPFEYGARLNETMILGIVALKADRAIEWDAAAGRVANAPDADQYLTREYRKGWEL
jgi:predicted dehydrogenase